MSAHGTLTRYAKDRCRCDECRAASVEYARRRRGGLGSPNRKAEAERSRRWYAANRERAIARKRRHYAENSERLAAEKRRARLANPERDREINRRRRANPAYRVAAAERSRRWRRANPEKAAEWFRQRRQAIRAATVAGPLSADALAARWAFFGGRCWLCRGEATEWDHVKPVSRGGLHILANLRPACRACNVAKRDRWPLSEVAA